MGFAATIAALTALAVPNAARAQTPPPAGGTIDNGTLKVDLDGVGGLEVTYLDSEQLFGGTHSRDGFALRSGGTVSYPDNRDPQTATTTVDGTTAVSDFSVANLGLHVRETDALTGPRDLTRTFQITNVGDTSLDVQAGELADALIGGSDLGRGVMPRVSPRMVAGLGPDGQLSGLVESANYPWAHWEEGGFSDIFSDFGSSGLHDTVDPNFVDNGFGVEWENKSLAPQGTWELQVIWRFDASMRVNSTADHDDGKCDPLTATTDCTLRDAVDNAVDGSVITVPQGMYPLDPRHGELSISKRLSIYGAGMTFEGGTTVDGAGGTRLFEVADGGDVLLSGLRLQGGNGTIGAIRARAALADGDGGAALVQEGGTLALEDSEVAGNTAAGHGGGIASSGTLTLRRSTVADNVAGTTAGGAQGGGLYLPAPATTSVLDSTVGDNTVYGAGAGIATGGPLTLLSSTIAGNRVAGDAGAGARGVLATDAAVTAHDSILAGGTPVCAGGAFTGDYDVVADASCNLSSAHVRQGVDPGLGRLTYLPSRFGDLAQTRAFAPQGNSPALDSGDNDACSDPLLEGMDQLGQPRIQRGVCDIGAVEVALAAPVISSPADGSSVGSTITFRGTAPPNVEVYVVSDDEADAPPVTSDAHGNWTLQYGPAASGTHTFTAFAMDPDGEAVSFPSDPLRLSVNGPPAPQISDTPVSGSTVTLTGTAAPGDAISILEGGTQVGSTTADGNGNWTVVLTNVAPGTHTYTAVAKDAAGNPSPPSPAKTVTVAGTQPAPGPTPTPTPVPTPTPTPLPPPVVGKAVNAQTKSGTIKIKLPGTNKFVELGPGQQIPTGTVVDTTHGRITLTTAVGGGRTQQADFYQGIFKVTQTGGRKPVTQLALVGPKPTCTTPRKHHTGRATAARKGKKKVRTRKLWGSGHGSFRTKGQYSSATVRGTTWLTQDSCAGTLTRVTHGVVQVRDFRRHKNVLVRAGHRYLARAKRH